MPKQPRLVGWGQTVSVTVNASTPDPVIITDLELGPDDDAIWAYVRTAAGDRCPFPWAYAILTWVTSEGRELGSATIHGPCEGEVFRISNGLTPTEKVGSIRLYPRSYNLAWIELGHPWTLSFRFQTGKLYSAGAAFGTRATLGVLADLDDARVSYAIDGDTAKVRLSDS